MKLLAVLSITSSLAFLIYGVFCAFTPSMVADFHRFGLDHLRILTGVLEILGGTGLLVGLRWRPALWLSAGGLALLMLIAFGVRLKMRDSVAQSAPSFLLMLLNLYILVLAREHPVRVLP
ncbi:MAG: DoxX family protein [Acidobacteriaceae bacterium]